LGPFFLELGSLEDCAKLIVLPEQSPDLTSPGSDVPPPD
jgi:hypothetical protein